MELLNKVKKELEQNKNYDFLSEIWDDENLCILYDAVYTTEKIFEKELNDLIEWKKSAMNIFSEIDLQAIGKELNIGLGQSVSENLLGKIQLHTEKNRIEGVLLGLKICKEMFAQGQISHENIYENEIAYKEELSKLCVS